jgi:hypothetical protein
MSNEHELPSPSIEAPDTAEAAAWIFALPTDHYEQLVDGYEAAQRADPASPLADFLEAWIEIERGKQSLLELLA